MELHTPKVQVVPAPTFFGVMNRIFFYSEDGDLFSNEQKICSGSEFAKTNRLAIYARRGGVRFVDFT